MASLTQEEAEERCSDYGYRWPNGVLYEGARKNYPLVCLTCGDDTLKRFDNVGRKGCWNCKYVAQSLAQILTQEEAVAQGLAAKHPAQLLEPYKGCMIKHKYRFLSCEHEHETRPNDLNNGQGCGACHYDQGPTYVYLMGKDGVLKVGIDRVEHKQRSITSRIHQHGNDGFVLVHKEKHRTRAEALAAEKTVIDSRDGGPALKPGELKYGGEGETFFENQVDVPAIIGMMR